MRELKVVMCKSNKTCDHDKMGECEIRRARVTKRVIAASRVKL